MQMTKAALPVKSRRGNMYGEAIQVTSWNKDIVAAWCGADILPSAARYPQSKDRLRLSSGVYVNMQDVVIKIFPEETYVVYSWSEFKRLFKWW